MDDLIRYASKQHSHKTLAAGFTNENSTITVFVCDPDDLTGYRPHSDLALDIDGVRNPGDDLFRILEDGFGLLEIFAVIVENRLTAADVALDDV